MTGLSAVIGSWKIIAMARAAQIAQARLAQPQQVLALEQDAARDRPQLALGQEAHDAVGGHRLARAGLADQAEDFPRATVEAHVLDRMRAIGARGQRDREPLQLEDRRLGRRRSRAPRRHAR